MTAQVSSVEATVAGGTVTFVDTYNGVSEALGTVQVQSTNGSPGVAILQTEVGGVGNHQFVATYNGTVLFAASSSSPQSVSFNPPYLSATALSRAGIAGSYTLTGAVSAFGPLTPTGSVTFTDTTSNVVLGTATLDAATIQTGFTSSQNYPITNMNDGQTGGTNGPAIGDFNGDGRHDLAIPTNGGPIVILLGNGDGTFTNGTSLTPVAPFEPTSVVVGDFNGDGRQDIAVLSASGIGSVNIYLGNGDGTFQAPKNYPVAASASSSRLLAMGDFNRDGIVDLVATNAGLNNVAVLLGNGDGSFQTPAYYGVGAGPWNVVVGDINQDGSLDLAVASDGSSLVSILQGNGDGTFKPSITANTGASQVGSVAIGDFNGDGFPDLATTSAPDNAIYILLNKKTAIPSFGAAKKHNMNSGPYYLTIGDFNRDGNLDIISANNGNNTVGILYGTGAGTFGAATHYTVKGGPIFATEGDINGDDQADLTAVTGNGVTVLLSSQSESASISNIGIFGCTKQSVSATYNGDANYAPSTSPALTFAAAKQTTALALTVTPANGVQGQQVTLQATLTPSAYGSATTNGERITFTDNGVVIGRATLASGVAVLNAVLRARGADAFQATYAGDCPFNPSTSNIVVGSTLRGSNLTWATPAPITYPAPLSATQLNATDDAPGGGTYTYSPAAGTILQAGTQTLSVTFTPNNVLYAQETATVQITVNKEVTVITWPTPSPITYGTPLSGFQLDATVSTGTVSVPLTSDYNVHGIYRPGSRYNTGGFDNDGYSYSTTTLGSTLVWNGLTFNLGPPNALDAVANKTITLPAGNFSNLFMLGAMVNNISANQTFTVTYTDGTTTTLNQNMSDWFNAAGWPGESVISCSEQRNFRNGATQPDSVCVYGYQIQLDPSKTVKTIQLPGTRNIVMLAMDLTTPAIPGTFVYNPPAGTIEPVGTDTLSVTFTPADGTDYTTSTDSVQLVVEKPITPTFTTTISWPAPASITYGTPLSSTQLDAVAVGTARPTPVVPNSQLQVLSTSTDGTHYNLAGFDGAGGTYSYDQLNNGSVNFAGSTFTLGSPTVPNAITNGAVYTLSAPGNYSALYLIGAATTTGQTNQPFILTYNDAGPPVVQTINMSSWAASAGYAGEAIVATTDHENTQNGGSQAGTFDLYGYQIPVDPTRTLVSVTVPNNRNVVIMALGFGANTQVVVPGSYVYTPPSGTVLAVGTHTLNVSFTPDNPDGYTGATGSTSLTVTQAMPILSWPTPAAIPVGTPLSSTQLDATASFQGAPLPGTFTYNPPAGTVLSAGTHTLSVLFTPDDSVDFANATATVQIVVGTGASSVGGSPVYSSGDCCFFSQPTPYTVTVSGSTAAPTGTVNVTLKGQTLGTGTLTPGSGASSSVVLLLDSTYFVPGNNTVTLNYLGDTNYAPTSNSATIPLRNPAIGSDPANVGGGTSTIYIPYTYVVPGSMTLNFNPAGGAASDFTNTGATTCTTGTQPAGTVCFLAVAFKPASPGIRKGVVEVDFAPTTGPAEPILYLFLSGLGSAAQIALGDATQSTLTVGLNQPQGVAFNPTDTSFGTLYVSNSDASQIVGLPSSGGAFTPWNAANTGNLAYPTDLAYNAFGDLLVADASSPNVFSFSPSLAEQTLSTGTITLGLPTANKVDLGGNLYIADGGNTPQIVVVPGETYDTVYTPSVLLNSSSVSFPQALGVDNTGANLYVGDGDNNQILKVALDGTGATSQVAIVPCDALVTPCAFNGPTGFAFDPNGDMYVTDGSRLLMIPATHSSGSPTLLIPMNGLLGASAVTLDGSGSIYVADVSGSVYKLAANAGMMTITGVGGTQTTTVTNTGNLALTITSLTFTNGASSAFSETDTCTSAAIPPGGSCTITVAYSNAAGTAPDTLNVSSNAFSATGVSIQVTH
jgi:hypothetical protein